LTYNRLKIFLITILLLHNVSVSSQKYRFLKYNAEDNLCDNFIYTINQDQNGYLWFGSGEGMCRFDGINFVSEFKGDSLPDIPVKVSFKDSKNRLWFGFDNGDIALYENQSFRLFSPEEKDRSMINGISEETNGNIVVATQSKGLIIITPDLSFSIVREGIEGQLVSSILITTGNDVLLGTYDGLFLYRFDEDFTKLTLVGRFEDIPYTNVKTIHASSLPNTFWVGTEDEGLFKLTKQGDDLQSFLITKIGEGTNIEYSDVRDIYEDENNDLWLATGGQGVFKLFYGELEGRFVDQANFTVKNGLPGMYIQDIFEDIEGNLWFASFGQGVAVLRDQSFLFYEYEDTDFGSNVLSLIQLEDEYWLGGEVGILITDLNGKRKFFIGNREGLPADKITALIYDDQSNVWVGTSRSGIYKINVSSRKVSKYFESKNSLENAINAFEKTDGIIWVATNGGVFSFNIRNGTNQKYSTAEGLPHNKVRDLLVDNNNNVWIATRSNGLYNLTQKNELKIDARAELEFTSIAIDPAGDLWAITNGDGVFEFTADSLLYYSTIDGLSSNYCYSIGVDSNEDIWIGHRLGMSRIEHESRIIKAYSIEQGFSTASNPNAVITNSRNNLVFGTSQGLIEYVPEKDRLDTIPPKLNISSLIISDVPYDPLEPVILDYGIYKIQLDFIGINFRNPEKVKYQYKLEGYDDWSEYTTTSSEIYSRVEDGKYTFMLRACDESGVCNEEPLQLTIQIAMPFWKRWWFVVFSIAFLISVVYVIIKIRERNQKQIQEYLQKSLDERTREVMEQKEEIENKNRDITDSINYAQRIQASILPPVKRLEDTFAGSFVFYQPRDIVSGDFYWYDRVWDDKFVIVCADSTGHGVPGAFMSMIGTTLIKDICSRPDVRSPSEILETLDMEIQEALNQNVDAEKSNDGMDIIVAEIDISKRYLRIASAMRPVVLYMNGEQIYVKGSRNSVGGRFDDESEAKVFKNEGFQMSKGDILYMFSDGYPDQFGGPLGKKFKMVRLKNLLRDIHDKPMEEQQSYIKSNFMLWKEDLEQVDDVLFMGIKF